MTDHIPIAEAAIADLASHGPVQTTAPNVAYQRLGIVNVVYVSDPATDSWVLVDAGIPGSARFIRRAARQRFGSNDRPAAIVMTHGHFDHVGALKDLASDWDVPVYAHAEELAYLDGTTPYPPPDPSVGGGMMAALSRFYPRGPIDVQTWLQPLPADETVPSMPGWRWVPTPGHTAGHVAFWREADRVLIAGDAFITTDQESAYSVLTQKLEIQGPPAYFTPDWERAGRSVHLLAGLEPELAVTGHGHAIHGEALRTGLQQLDEHFDQVAVPDHGQYVPDAS